MVTCGSPIAKKPSHIAAPGDCLAARSWWPGSCQAAGEVNSTIETRNFNEVNGPCSIDSIDDLDDMIISKKLLLYAIIRS